MLIRLVLASWIVLIASACQGPAGMAKVGPPVHEDCTTPGDEDGNGSVDCSDPACAASPACRPACGNGKREPGEQCDDGNTVDGDGCDHNCTVTACGNAVIALDEVCDDGNTIDGDGCDHDCTITRCGNHVVTAGEQCDDGNTIDGDGCDHDCTITACGNRIVTAGEACDDGNAIDGDGCDHDCTITACGNGIVTTGEACDDGNRIDGDGCDHDCTVTACGNGIVTTGEACDDGNQIDDDGCHNDCTSDTLAQLAYIKSPNSDAFDQFGFAIALSADGSTLAIAAIGEDSGATGTGGDPNDDSVPDSGAVYLYTRSGRRWTQQAYIKAPNPDRLDAFGTSLALSADGSTLAVGTPLEDSSASGVNGNPADNAGEDSGAVYIYTRSGTTWSAQAYLKASNSDPFDGFGFSVSLSADGATLAVGARDEDSAATGVNGNQADNSKLGSGAVYVFARDGATWHQQAYLKAATTDLGDRFGHKVALSADGATLAVGAYAEGSAATGVGGDATDNSLPGAGAAYLFTRSGTSWTQQAYIKASNPGPGDFFGADLALSGDGSTLAVAAPDEDGAATGIDGDQTSNAARLAGAVYVFTRSGTTWRQQAYVKASNTESFDQFGTLLALSGDGSTLVATAFAEASAAAGVNGNQADNTQPQAGAAYLFQRVGGIWSQQFYLKASNPGAGDGFGLGIALSADASTIAVGAQDESSDGRGVGGNQDNNNASSSGAVYVFQ
jgi:cysteine-rich repeat protein